MQFKRIIALSTITLCSVVTIFPISADAKKINSAAAATK